LIIFGATTTLHMKNIFLKLISFAFILLFISVSGYTQNTSNAERINYYNNKAKKYLDKKQALSPFYLVNEKGINMYSSAQNKANNKPEFHLNWNEIEAFKTTLKIYSGDELLKIYKSGKMTNVVPDALKSKNPNGIQTKKDNTKKLQGLKIAIDPGHTAGDMETAKIEAKCLNFQCVTPKGEKCNVAISEGILTFATATLLKNELEAQGAEVFMTRTFYGGSAYGKSFDNWLKPANIDSLYKTGDLSRGQRAKLLNPKISKSAKFQSVFKNLELQKRSEIINNYQPDFTVIIHFNVDETNRGWAKPGNKNHNMTFVGGAFMGNDLSSPVKRMEFLRLLVTDDLEKSIALSSSVVNSFENTLNVKTASHKDATYLVKGCLPAATGVYCRNLQLTRYIHSPLVYGETLYQDNINECILLNEETDKTKNKRIQQVADAYFKGILDYVNKTNINY
jgi:N-acetylmuramoyl-L-alanine amidase